MWEERYVQNERDSKVDCGVQLFIIVGVRIITSCVRNRAVACTEVSCFMPKRCKVAFEGFAFRMP